jgi:hypothetical protein
VRTVRTKEERFARNAKQELRRANAEGKRTEHALDIATSNSEQTRHWSSALQRTDAIVTKHVLQRGEHLLAGLDLAVSRVSNGAGEN